jgi:hypothetical protein
MPIRDPRSERASPEQTPHHTYAPAPAIERITLTGGNCMRFGAKHAMRKMAANGIAKRVK